MHSRVFEVFPLDEVVEDIEGGRRMTRYEVMIRRAEILHRAFVNAHNRDCKELWYRQYQQLVIKAKSLTIEQAEEIVR